MIDHNRKAIMVHIDKCAGTSICNMFDSYEGGHSTWKMYAEHFPEEWDTYFKFAFVRNPWDRVVSSFFWHVFFCEMETYKARRRVNRTTQKKALDKQQMYRDWLQNFNHFLRDPDGLPRIIRSTNNKKWYPCHKFIYDDDMNCMVDYVGRYENLNLEMAYIQGRIGMENNPMPHNNTMRHKRPHYTALYNDESVEIVRELYATDIELFGYEFERKMSYDDYYASCLNWV